MNALILLAGGKGSRMEDSVPDKTLADLNGKAVLLHSLEAFKNTRAFDRYFIVFRDGEQKAEIQSLVGALNFNLKAVSYVKGGNSRQASVYNALKAINEAVDLVAIHDGARPMIKESFILQLLDEAQKFGSAIACSPVIDTIKSVDLSSKTLGLCIASSMDRLRLRATQTPQIFSYPTILEAYKKVDQDKINITDEVEALTHSQKQVHLTQNPRPNPKITTKNDLNYILYLLNKNPLH